MIKTIKINRRIALSGIFAFIFFPNQSFSNQNALTNLIQPQILGSSDAPIKIKEYFSLTCGHCASFHKKTLPKLQKKYIDKGQIQLEFIDYPLDRLALVAATLARSLPTKEGYVEAIKILLNKQKQWAYSEKPLDELFSIAKLFGISSKKFDDIIKNTQN